MFTRLLSVVVPGAIIIMSCGCREGSNRNPVEFTSTTVATSSLRVPETPEAFADPSVEPTPKSPSLTSPHGRWVGRSPDGTERIELAFQTNGRVTWKLTTEAGETSVLTARFEWGGQSDNSELRIFDFDRPLLRDGQFLGNVRFETKNMLILNGKLGLLDSDVKSPLTFDSYAVRLIRTTTKSNH